MPPTSLTVLAVAGSLHRDSVTRTVINHVARRLREDGCTVDVLDFEKGANHKVYGDNADAQSILSSSRMASNVNVRPFVDALDRAMPMRRSTR